MEFYKMSATEISEGVKAGRWRASEVLAAHLKRIKKIDKRLNATVTLSEESAARAADDTDKSVREGKDPGPLAGVPFIVKDNFCTEGVKTTCCSRMLEGWVPEYDATSVKKMRDAGAVLIGKANMDEFAMGSTTESSFFGPTLNPRDLSRVPGGSSGGSAAAVAAGYCPVALGSDTGGSVRQPSAFCGVHGMKPSYGQISRFGVVAYASSLDQVGPVTRDIKDMAAVMDVLAVPDENDNTCLFYERPSFSSSLSDGIEGKKVAVLGGYDTGLVDPAILDGVKMAVEYCGSAGAEIEEARLPVTMKHSAACYYMTAWGDASSKLACFDGMRYGHHEDGKNLFEMYKNSRTGGFGEEVRKRILIGTCILSKGFYEDYYLTASKVRRIIADECVRLFENIDALICPVSPFMPTKAGMAEKDPARIKLGDAFASLANLAGIPAISLNIGFSNEGLPLNIQLIGPRFGDAGLLSLASVLEKMAGRPHVAEINEEGGAQ